MIIDKSWSLEQLKRKRARFKEIALKNMKILEDLRAGKLIQNKHKGIWLEQ